MNISLFSSFSLKSLSGVLALASGFARRMALVCAERKFGWQNMNLHENHWNEMKGMKCFEHENIFA